MYGWDSGFIYQRIVLRVITMQIRDAGPDRMNYALSFKEIRIGSS